VRELTECVRYFSVRNADVNREDAVCTESAERKADLLTDMVKH